jgi:ABC-type nickel/cobalt efflux system permease component RcnA
MKTIISKLKNNSQRLIVSLFLLAIYSPAYSQGNSFEDKYFTVEITVAVIFVVALGVWMLVSMLKQKNRDNKKVRQHLHRKHNQLSHIKY